MVANRQCYYGENAGTSHMVQLVPPPPISLGLKDVQKFKHVHKAAGKELIYFMSNE